MKILASVLFISAFSLGASYWFNTQTVNAAIQKEAQVLVCKSPYAARFHLDKDCVGLNKCKREIISVTKSQAEEEGLTCCGFCCKKK